MKTIRVKVAVSNEDGFGNSAERIITVPQMSQNEIDSERVWHALALQAFEEAYKEAEKIYEKDQKLWEI